MFICDNKTKLRLFKGINSEYWNLKGDERKRAINLINQLDFNRLIQYSYYELDTEKLLN